MKKDFLGKTALVTGGASGIGRALSQQMARYGARVVIADIDEAAAIKTAEEISDAGGDARGVALDVIDRAAFLKLAEEIAAENGSLDFLFNNAGIGITGEVRDLGEGAWNRVLDTNLRGVIHGVEAVYPIMVNQGSGHIANTACIAGLVPFPMTAAYCASKHAVVALSTALRAEAAELGVRVSVICPGTVDTGLFEAIEYFRVDREAVQKTIKPFLMPVERCAEAILRGVRRNKSVIIITLHARLVWWLYRLAPRTFLAMTAKGFRIARGRLRTPNNSDANSTVG